MAGGVGRAGKLVIGCRGNAFRPWPLQCGEPMAVRHARGWRCGSSTFTACWSGRFRALALKVRMVEVEMSAIFDWLLVVVLFALMVAVIAAP